MSQHSVKKRVCLSIDAKWKLLEEVDAKILTKTEIAQKHGIPKNTLSTILKARENIEKAHGAVAPIRKYSRGAKNPELEKALVAWLRKMRGRNVPIDGKLLKEQAEIFALRLNLTDFKGSDGWLQKFKLRHGLTFRKICGESAAVDQVTTTAWKENNLKMLLEDYAPEDVFNADETGLFFKLLPDRTLVFKGETCSGGKRAKQRITVLLGSNMTGSEKLPLLLIGKSKKPRCFKNVRSLPAVWEANKKAWMTGVIYEKWVKNLDRQFHQKKRKVLLILDNCTAHVPVEGLQAIRIEFLPPNVTSVLQPMDQGIIQAFKRHYRRMLLRRVVLNFENDQVYEVDVLGAMHFAVHAWSLVQQDTIANCFRHAGFVSASPNDDESEARATAIAVRDAEDDAILIGAYRTKHNVQENVTFEDFSAIDEQLQCIEEVSDDDIIKQALSAETESADELSEEDDSVCQDRPSLKAAAEAVLVLRRFFETSENGVDMLNHLDSLERSIYKSVTLKQSKLTGFFAPGGK